MIGHLPFRAADSAQWHTPQAFHWLEVAPSLTSGPAHVEGVPVSARRHARGSPPRRHSNASEQEQKDAHGEVPESARATQMLRMQQLAGNTAVNSLLGKGDGDPHQHARPHSRAATSTGLPLTAGVSRLAHSAADSRTSRPQDALPVQRADPVSIAGLGVAVFSTGRAVSTSGRFASTSNVVRYVHQGTPPEASWQEVETTLQISAHHPRIGWGRQRFYFKLIYERNGHDIRNARIIALIDRSSGMYTSTFRIQWDGIPHSRDTNPVAEVAFNIINSEWDPHGRGHVSFDGQLVISADKGSGTYNRFVINAEKWVRRESPEVGGTPVGA